MGGSSDREFFLKNDSREIWDSEDEDDGEEGRFDWERGKIKQRAPVLAFYPIGPHEADGVRPDRDETSTPQPWGGGWDVYIVDSNPPGGKVRFTVPRRCRSFEF